MKIITIGNEHLLSHRYGWIKIINELCEKIDNNLLLVDFMDKYFNLWFEENKIFTINNKKYYFKNKDAHYYINDDEKNDVFIYYDEINNYHIIKWCPEYNDFKFLKGELLYKFKRKYNFKIINNYWVGFLHYPLFPKEMNTSSGEEFINIIKSQTFIKSQDKCKCIITLSKFLKNQCDTILSLNKINIPVYSLYHPTDFNCKYFDMDKYNNNNNKYIIQIGSWLRKVETIYKLKTTYNKIWLPGTTKWTDLIDKSYIDDNLVKVMVNLSNDSYDELLEKNIVLLNVYSSSANNTVLECIARNTPLISIKHPAIMEYLGDTYPLYFQTLDELNILINSKNFNDKIIETHIYLKTLDKTKLTIKNFIDNFYNIISNI